MAELPPTVAGSTASRRDAPTIDLLEREQYLAELDEHLRLATAGNGRVVLVGGEAGIGKTALVTRFSRQMCEPAQVLQTSCDALSTPGPLGPLRDIAPALGIDVRAYDSDPDSRDMLFRSVLSALAARQATVIIAEDAHWADGASLELLRFLARRIGAIRLLIVVTFRDDELGPFHPLRRILGDLAAAPTVARISLPPLSLAAVQTLAAGQHRDARDLHQLTGGNPFFLREILAAEDESIPPTVGDAVLARVARLTPEARAVLDTAAVIGTSADLDLLIMVAGPVYDEIDSCVASGLLRCEEHRLFRHELVREAILSAMTPPRRRLLHGRVLAALCERPSREPDFAQLAHHAEEAADSAAVHEYALAAANQANMLHAHREAAAQYARVLRWCHWLEDRERATLLNAMSESCYLSDQVDDAIAARLAALAIWRQLDDKIAEGDSLRWLSRLYWLKGHGDDANNAAEAALAILEPLPPGPALAMAYSNLSQLRMLAYDHHAAIHLGERAIALSEQFGDQATLVHALNNVGSAQVALDPYGTRGEQELERSLRLAMESGFVDHAGRALVNLAWSALKRMDLGLADQRLATAIAYATEHELATYHAYHVATRAMLRFHRGAWDKALADAWDVLRRPALSSVIRIMALTPLGLIQARRGDRAAMATLDEALDLAKGTGELQRLGPLIMARAEAAHLAGDRDRALREARQIADLVQERGNPWHKGAIAWLLWQAGDRDQPTSELAAPYQLQLAGNWVAAASAWQALDCPYEAALALMTSNEIDDIWRALETFERLAARPAIRLARQRLRALGVRDLPALRRGPLPSTRENPAGLTRREAEVLDLLREGLSRAEIADQLFLTSKTVSHHLSAVYAKLGVTNREDAISAAAKVSTVQS